MTRTASAAARHVVLVPRAAAPGGGVRRFGIVRVRPSAAPDDGARFPHLRHAHD